MLDPKICLVTGATRGLGYALAKDAASRGAHVLAVGRNQGALDELADEIDKVKGAVTLVPMDLCDDNAIAYLAKSIFERWGRLDYWYHAAWFTAPMQPVPQMLGKDLDEAYQTNIRTTARMISALESIMRNTLGAHAVFFDDPNVHGAHMGNIGMSKSAQMEIVRAWMKEAKRIGPDVQIQTPNPMIGHLRATLFPGENRDHLALPQREAERILDMTMAL